MRPSAVVVVVVVVVVLGALAHGRCLGPIDVAGVVASSLTSQLGRAKSRMSNSTHEEAARQFLEEEETAVVLTTPRPVKGNCDYATACVMSNASAHYVRGLASAVFPRQENSGLGRFQLSKGTRWPMHHSHLRTSQSLYNH